MYLRGGPGGIFSPTLFFGAAIGLAFSNFCGPVLVSRTNFYNEIIERDGIELERYMPRQSLISFQSRPISTLANFSPIFGPPIAMN